MTKLLMIVAVLLVAYMTVWFCLAKIRNRLDTVDIAWGGGFVLAAWASLIYAESSRSLIIAMLVTLWGVRLALHIWQRSAKKHEDARYKEISSKWTGNYWLRAYWSVFLLQGVLIWLVGLPIMVATGREIPSLAWLTYVGTFIWMFGFVFEAVADYQLQEFLKIKNHPKLLQTGLWKYSRHPNYFGELVQWWGIGIIALQVSFGWVGLVGPSVLSILIIFISGIPPIEKRKAKDPDFQRYKQKTSSLIPLPNKHST